MGPERRHAPPVPVARDDDVEIPTKPRWTVQPRPEPAPASSTTTSSSTYVPPFDTPRVGARRAVIIAIACISLIVASAGATMLLTRALTGSTGATLGTADAAAAAHAAAWRANFISLGQGNGIVAVMIASNVPSIMTPSWLNVELDGAPATFYHDTDTCTAGPAGTWWACNGEHALNANDQLAAGTAIGTRTNGAHELELIDSVSGLVRASVPLRP